MQRNQNKEKSRKLESIISKDDDLSIDQIDELFEAFTLFDKDYNGAVSAEELGVIMKSVSLNATENELDDMVNEADTENNKLIDFPEFVSVLARNAIKIDDNHIKNAFDIFDKNKEGHISVKSLMEVLQEVGEFMDESEVKQLLGEASIDGLTEETSGDPLISLQDFERMMKTVMK